MHPFPSEDALHVLIALPSGVVVFNHQNRVVFANPAAVQFLQCDYDHLICQDREAFCSEFGIPPDLGVLPATISIYDYSYQIQYVPFGQPKQSKQLLSQYVFYRETLTHERLWDIVTGLAHEFRGPLAVLSGYTDLLARELVGPVNPEQRDLLERMRHLEHNLQVSVRQHLLFGALARGTLWLDRSLFDLDEILRESIQRCTQTYADRRISLITQ